MISTNVATFEADFPDDSIESEGDIIVPAGRNVMEVIRSCIASLGYKTTPVIQHSFYGWNFFATRKASCFWLLLQHPNSWLLIVNEPRSILSPSP